jgi:hypothetical protein
MYLLNNKFILYMERLSIFIKIIDTKREIGLAYFALKGVKDVGNSLY